MKIGIVGDLHDNLRHFAIVCEGLNSHKVDVVAFTGDFTSPFSLRTFKLLNAPVKAVLGNGDPDIQKFQYQLQNLPILKNLKIEISPRIQDFKLDDKRIAITHGDDKKLVEILVESQLYDVLCVGHTHTMEIKKIGKTTIINSGSLVGYMYEKGNTPIYYTIYDTMTNIAQAFEIKIP